MRGLKEDHCVLLTGPPAVGKTYLENEVRELFRAHGRPVSQPSQAVAIPAGATATSPVLPSPDRQDRKVFELPMHQEARYRHAWREVEVDPSGGFRISKGILWQANEHALTDDGTALVIMDEFNRGPVIKVLGPSLGALEGDKRLDENGVDADQTVHFQLPDDAGDLESYALSSHLYVLAGQNNADTSVEPIDTAMLRRWREVRLEPDPSVLESHFGLSTLEGDLPEEPADAAGIYLAAVRAWQNVNDAILIGRGRDYQIGHGVLMNQGEAPPDTVDEAKTYISKGWQRIETHINEVFFSNVEAQAATLGVGDVQGHPYKLEFKPFGPRDVAILERPSVTDPYPVLRAVAGG